MARRDSCGGGGSGRLRRIAVAAVAQLALGACYNFTPVESRAVPVGSDVRVHVTRDVGLSVGAVPLDLDGGSVVFGKVEHTPTADTLYCDVALRAPADGSARRGLRGTVSIPASAIERVEIRTLDRTRTGGIVLVGALLGWVVLDASFNVRNPNPQSPEGGSPDNARITVFRLRW